MTCARCGTVFRTYPSLRAKYCSRACARDTAPAEPILFAIWFWTGVAVSPDQARCWEYIRRQNTKGYGVVLHREGRKETMAHRIAYKLGKGDIPDGLVVRHLCNNRACCNPNHLAVGTQRDNAHDRERTRPSVLARLSPENVRAIRRRRRAGERVGVLAKAFGVGTETITAIIRRRTWAWLEDD